MGLRGKGKYVLQALTNEKILQCFSEMFSSLGYALSWVREKMGSLLDTATCLSYEREHREDCEEASLLYLKEKRKKKEKGKEIVNLQAKCPLVSLLKTKVGV